MGIPIHYKQENAEKTHYPDESFDLVVSVIMFHETSQSALPNILGESYRLLKPGGMMLHLDVPGGADPFSEPVKGAKTAATSRVRAMVLLTSAAVA